MGQCVYFVVRDRFSIGRRWLLTGFRQAMSAAGPLPLTIGAILFYSVTPSGLVY